MKKDYQKLSITPLETVVENSILQASITMGKKITVKEYQDGFGGTLEDPGIVNLSFD